MIASQVLVTLRIACGHELNCPPETDMDGLAVVGGWSAMPCHVQVARVPTFDCSSPSPPVPILVLSSRLVWSGWYDMAAPLSISLSIPLTRTRTRTAPQPHHTSPAQTVRHPVHVRGMVWL